jgi:hypothetical protein
MNGAWVRRLAGVDKGFGRWLGLAVLLHAAALLLPLTYPQGRPPVDRSLIVSLLRPVPLPAPAAEPQPPPAPVSVTAQKRPVPSAAAPRAEAAPPPRLPSTKEILESAQRPGWTLPAEPTLRLGEFVPPAPPRNWQPSITVEENLFGDAYLPAETEIVDRWLAADGSHNVVIRAPNGMTLCGRALPWNPMEPLVEHVMMFRSCGGGGKRSFSTPERLLPRYRRPGRPGSE